MSVYYIVGVINQGDKKMMILESSCDYVGDIDTSELPQCMLCGHRINYIHRLRNSETGEIINVGRCCARKHDKRDPLKGRYDWRMQDTRKAAYWNWYNSSLAHAK